MITYDQKNKLLNFKMRAIKHEVLNRRGKIYNPEDNI